MTDSRENLNTQEEERERDWFERNRLITYGGTLVAGAVLWAMFGPDGGGSGLSGADFEKMKADWLAEAQANATKPEVVTAGVGFTLEDVSNLIDEKFDRGGASNTTPWGSEYPQPQEGRGAIYKNQYGEVVKVVNENGQVVYEKPYGRYMHAQQVHNTCGGYVTGRGMYNHPISIGHGGCFPGSGHPGGWGHRHGPDIFDQHARGWGRQIPSWGFNDHHRGFRFPHRQDGFRFSLSEGRWNLNGGVRW